MYIYIYIYIYIYMYMGYNQYIWDIMLPINIFKIILLCFKLAVFLHGDREYHISLFSTYFNFVGKTGETLNGDFLKILINVS